MTFNLKMIISQKDSKHTNFVLISWHLRQPIKDIN